ncbi:hypothetical protein [Heliorestis convoluta]|uniref:Uncharacterized protein n=1 Tax=Heliorestis convoluta TaxID=356322 RepID=A0A5Q2MYB5_9FIRM|nr:hypothetical protein [Heliorestis convoluta]QGG47627.1 hypothetical protein FTV88_1527 [Heliorestis convoluta]
MTIIRYSSDSHSTVKYIKNNLEFIGNITSFEAYFNDEDIPEIYRNVPDVYLVDGKRKDSSKNYTLILRDDENEQEIWLDGANCGYGGSGPCATVQILQTLGIKYDYERIHKEKIINEKNPVSFHDLNMIVYRPEDVIGIRQEKILKVKMSFEKAYQKYNTKKSLEQLGIIQPLSNFQHEHDNNGDIETYYFDNLPYSTKKEWADYTTNNALTLKQIYAKLDTETIEDIIRDISYNYSESIEVEKL